MAKTLKLVSLANALVAALLLTTTGARGQDGDARDLVRRGIEALPKQPFVAKMTVSSDQFEPRELKMSRKYVGGAHGSYLEVIAPDELEGIRFLFLERTDKPNEQYIKVKASRTAVRVSEEVRRQPFLGSAFYVSDLVMPDLDNYTYRYVGKDVIGGRTVTLVEMVPKKPEGELYAKTILGVDPDDLLILRREFFDKDGEKIKVWTVDKVEKIDGILSLTGQEMVDVQEDAKSRLDVSDLQYNADVPDKMFTPKYLLR